MYLEFDFVIKPLHPATEILIAQLAEVGFDSFVESEKGLQAYTLKSKFKKEDLETVSVLKSKEFQISYTQKEIETTNWNTEWEENFTPIQIDNLVTIRASFHTKENTKYDIIIQPKMSFGTGHHETTHMMVQHQLKIDFKNKNVLDMGCGTGVLAILAEKLGAKNVKAVDIDSWCIENTQENIERNKCKKIEVYKGNVTILRDFINFDVIIANINRNVLLEDISMYVDKLNGNGILLLSGFYDKDFEIIHKSAIQYNLILEKKIERNSWLALQFIKN